MCQLRSPKHHCHPILLHAVIGFENKTERHALKNMWNPKIHHNVPSMNLWGHPQCPRKRPFSSGMRMNNEAIQLVTNENPMKETSMQGSFKNVSQNELLRTKRRTLICSFVSTRTFLSARWTFRAENL